MMGNIDCAKPMKYSFISPASEILILISMIIISGSCKHKDTLSETKIMFLHHSTGGVIWQGEKTSLVTKAAEKLSPRLAKLIGEKDDLPKLFDKYNKEHNTNYII